jgi:hypothetical protein
MTKKETKKEAKKEAEVKEAPAPEPAKVEIVNTANGPMVKGPNGSLRPLPAEK